MSLLLEHQHGIGHATYFVSLPRRRYQDIKVPSCKPRHCRSHGFDRACDGADQKATSHKCEKNGKPACSKQEIARGRIERGTGQLRCVGTTEVNRDNTIDRRFCLETDDRDLRYKKLHRAGISNAQVLKGFIDLLMSPDLLTLNEKQAMELFSRCSQSLQLENA